jgi:Cu/Ag efflux pump CusA
MGHGTAEQSPKQSVRAALKRAKGAIRRLRPVVMTALVASLGLVPREVSSLVETVQDNEIVWIGNMIAILPE